MSAASVTMLRSRAASPGLFQTSPRRRSCVYLSRAGATDLTSSCRTVDVGTATWASAAAEAEKQSDARVVARAFIMTSARKALRRATPSDIAQGRLVD